MDIEIKGTIIPNDFKDVYEWCGIEHTSPSMIDLSNLTEDVNVYINSHGGDVYSGSEIYTKLKNYKGKVTTIVTGLAASIASVIAMGGDVIKMSPTSQIMIHNVSAISKGDKNVMSHEAEVLRGYDKTIANAYRIKTGLSEEELLKLMDNETWLTPQEAKEKGFVDEIMFENEKIPQLINSSHTVLPREMVNIIKNKIQGEKMNNLDTETKEGINEVKTEEKIQEDKELNEKENKGVDDKKIESLRIENKISTFKNEVTESKNLRTIEGVKNNMKTYREAFFNTLLGRTLSGEEKELIARENAVSDSGFIHDTTNTSIVIPKSTQEQIWARATEGYGVLEDVKKLSVKGELRLVKHKAIESGDAKWYLENTKTEDEKNTFEDLVLKGHELSKAVTISWKLKSMAMNDFEQYLIEELAQRISIALGSAVVQGTGTNEPTGIITALGKLKNAQTVTAEEEGKISYQEITQAISKVHSSYKKGAKIYANSNVIWTVLANVVDGFDRPFFVPTSADGVANILGFTVKEDASLKDDEILFGNVTQGYVFNINESLSMTVEEHAKQRQTDYVGYMIADGNVLDEKAFALLKLKQVKGK